VRERLGLDARSVASRVTSAAFGDASLARCDATCCKGGVALSTVERDAILSHAKAVTRAMAASPRCGVPAPPDAWFTERGRRDPDFLCGRSVDTRVVSGGCVFLREDRLCAVHVASDEVTGHPYTLKPAYCILFPLCVEKGAVDLCRGSYTRRPGCCSPVRGGKSTPLSLLARTLRALKKAPGRRRRQGSSTGPLC